MPRAMSSPSEPVEIASTSMMRSLAPSRMIEPLPKFLSIWASAASSALCLSISAPSTIRSDGLHWVNPNTKRLRVSTRIRNHETTLAKVNDADGNPIEIAAVVVWQVEDTAKAVFGVDNLSEFVAIQAETAVRQIASDYPYDDQDGGLSLRGSAGEINARLAEQISHRVAPAGVKIVEARLTRLSYAPEIAHAMLRRQQAGAMVAARQRIVEGAVGMVESALARLDENGLVELDAERKAAMVSNMLVVLCSDHPTQPVINTGTLYQ